MSGRSALRTAAVLVASDCETTTRALLSVLRSQGYAVGHVRSGRAAVDMVRSGWPSVVVVDACLPDMPGVDVCLELRGDPLCAGITPVILVNADGARRVDRLTAFAAGAWEVCPQPLDGALLLARLETFGLARQAAARSGETSLLDPELGVYSLGGLLMRARELQALGMAAREPLSFVAFSTRRTPWTPAGGAPSAVRVVGTCRAILRSSDVLGRVGPDEFAILAPATSTDGAARILARVRDALARADDGEPDGPQPDPGCALRAVCGGIDDCADPGASAPDALLAIAASLSTGEAGDRTLSAEC